MTQKPYASLNIWKCRNRNMYWKLVLKKNQRIFYLFWTPKIDFWIIRTMRKCKFSFRIISGLLCDKPWCDPIVLTTIAVGLGKLEDFQWTIFNTHSCCPFSASIPPLVLPFASSFLLLLLLAAVYGALTGVR